MRGIIRVFCRLLSLAGSFDILLLESFGIDILSFGSRTQLVYYLPLSLNVSGPNGFGKTWVSWRAPRTVIVT